MEEEQNGKHYISHLAIDNIQYNYTGQYICRHKGVLNERAAVYIYATGMLVIQLFTKRQNFGLVQIQSICRRQNKFRLKIENCILEGRKHCGKRRKCWLAAFSPFPTMFSKVLLIWGSLKVRFV